MLPEEAAKKKDTDRKPADYDESELPDVLSSPLMVRRDYDAPDAMALEVMIPGDMPSHRDMTGPHGRGMGPGGGKGQCHQTEEVPELAGVPTVLICPECQEEAPIDMDIPPGVPVAKLAYQCPDCGCKIPMTKIAKSASDGKFRLV